MGSIKQIKKSFFISDLKKSTNPSVLEVGEGQEGPNPQCRHALHIDGVPEVHNRDGHIVGGKVQLVKLLVVVLLAFLGREARTVE